MATKTAKTAAIAGTNGSHRKEGLRLPQVFILAALAKGGQLTRTGIAESVGKTRKSKHGDSVAWTQATLGSRDKATREGRDEREGYRSLLSLGYVRCKEITPEEGARVEYLYEITAGGKKALAKAERELAAAE